MIRNLLFAGCDDIIIVTGYLEHMIREFVSIHFPSVKVQFIRNDLYAATNNIYSLWMVKDAVENESMLMMDSDIVFDRRIIPQLLNSGLESCLALKRHEVGEEEIKVKTDASGRITGLNKEIPPSEAIGESIGIEYFGKNGCAELFEILERKVVLENKGNVFYETAFEELSENCLYVVDTSDYFCMEIDTAGDLEAARELISRNN
jgi:choline kinase